MNLNNLILSSFCFSVSQCLTIFYQTENSFERTIVYQTMHENFVVIVQQNRLNEKEDWSTKNHCMIPKNFVNFIAQLSDKPQSTSGGFITSGGIIPPSTLSDPLHTYDISNLPVGTKKIFYKYDCDCVPFYENQLGVLQECDNLADLLGASQISRITHQSVSILYSYCRSQPYVEPRQHTAKPISFLQFEKQQFVDQL